MNIIKYFIIFLCLIALQNSYAAIPPYHGFNNHAMQLKIKEHHPSFWRDQYNQELWPYVETLHLEWNQPSSADQFVKAMDWILQSYYYPEISNHEQPVQSIPNIIPYLRQKFQHAFHSKPMQELPTFINQNFAIMQDATSDPECAHKLMHCLYNRWLSSRYTPRNEILQTLCAYINVVPNKSIEWINPKTGQNITHTILIPMHWIDNTLECFLQKGIDLCRPTDSPDKHPGSTIPLAVAYMRFAQPNPFRKKYAAVLFLAKFFNEYPATLNKKILDLINNAQINPRSLTKLRKINPHFFQEIKNFTE